MTRLTVGDCHARICNGRPFESIEKDCIITFEEARRWFADSDRTPASCAALFSAISTYAARVPMEDVYSEHLLMVLRRAAISTLHGAKADLPAFVDHITEPAEARRVSGLSPSHAVKSESEVRYEFARLLSELRAYPDGIELFDDVVGANEAPPLLRGYALHGKAVFLQNMGFFRDALETIQIDLRRLMDSEIRTADQAAGLSSLAHFAAKAEATALRRCHFRTLLADADVQAKIQGCFDAARQNFDTYHLQYSEGYYHYVLNDPGKALRHFQECRRMLQGHEDQYYQIHFWHLLARIAAGDPLKSGEIESSIRAYRMAAEKYGNFKSVAAGFLSGLVQSLCDNEEDDVITDKVVSHLRANIATFEDLRHIDLEVMTLLNHFGISTVKCKEQIDRLTARFDAKSDLLDRRIKVDATFGIAACIDIRGFTALAREQDPRRLTEALLALRTAVADHVAAYCDILVGTGDGYLMVKQMDAHGTAPADAVPLIFALVRLLEHWGAADESRPSLGVGVSCGQVRLLRLPPRGPLPRPDLFNFVGDAANVATEMCHLARPLGMVVNAESFPSPEHVTDLIRQCRFRETKGSGKDGRTYRLLASPEVNELWLQSGRKFTYLFRSRFAEERRIFVAFGRRCRNHCVYCNRVRVSPPPFDADSFQREVGDLFSIPGLTGRQILFSIGCDNEPLLEETIGDAAQAAVHLLQGTARHGPGNHVVQIATKCDAKTLHALDGALSRTGWSEDAAFRRERLCVLLSCASLSHGTALKEPARPGLPDVRDSFRNFRVIPYVKPFLPFFTDGDTRLRDFLHSFGTVVVGHGYFTRHMMRRLWAASRDVCKDDSPCYEWRWHRHQPDLQLPLSPPGRQGAGFVAPRFGREMEGFITALQAHGIHVFRSSACAVASLNRETCYTSVGQHPQPGVTESLCRGQTSCSNESCMYNASGGRGRMADL